METTIDIKSFFENYKLIIAKFEAISKLPGAGADFLKDFDYLEIQDGTVSYHTSEYNRGETDTNEYTLTFDELDKPLEYFEAQFKIEYELKLERERIKKEQAEEYQKEQRRKQFEALQAEFGKKD